MPVDFLTQEQARRYGRYAGDPSPEQLAHFFYLSDTDLACITLRRGHHNRLGFAVQLCTVRFLGTFLADPTEVPQSVVGYLATQLGIDDTGCLDRYLQREETRRKHTEEIRQRFRYRPFNDQPGHFRLVRWLYTRAWLSDERPSVLFDLATARLVEQKVLLPGVTTLTRLIARIRERVSHRLYETMAALPNAEQRKRLDALLVSEDRRLTPLERLRRSPTRVSSTAMVKALERLEEIRKLGVSTLDTSSIPAGRCKHLARYAATTWAPKLARMNPQRRTAMLVAFAQHYEVVALDEALDLFALLVEKLFKEAREQGRKRRLESLKAFDQAALLLRQACQILLDPVHTDDKVRGLVFSRIQRQDLVQAVDHVGQIAQPTADHYYQLLKGKYRTLRRFLPRLLGPGRTKLSPAAK